MTAVFMGFAINDMKNITASSKENIQLSFHSVRYKAAWLRIGFKKDLCTCSSEAVILLLPRGPVNLEPIFPYKSDGLIRRMAFCSKSKGLNMLAGGDYCCCCPTGPPFLALSIRQVRMQAEWVDTLLHKQMCSKSDSIEEAENGAGKRTDYRPSIS